jgi:hypothetical protein
MSLCDCCNLVSLVWYYLDLAVPSLDLTYRLTSGVVVHLVGLFEGYSK